MPSLIQRLKERRLVQWTLAYLAGAFVALQVMDALEGPLFLSRAIQRGVLVVLVLGLPVALVVAWYHGEEGRQRISVGELSIIVTLSLIAGLLAVSTARDQTGFGSDRAELTSPSISGTATSPQSDLDPRRLAVLPFEHRSASSDDQYFTDGIHDDLLSQLAKVSGLEVISRTSVERYTGTTEAIPQIARALGAGTVIEGGVQRAGNRVRINVQVIDGSTDAHLWSETYDDAFSVESLFEVQEAIVLQVAAAVKATLLPAERTLVGAVPTSSDEGYELYKRARHLWLRGERNDFERIIDLYERAVELDTLFALAHAGLSEVYADRAGTVDTEALIVKAKEAGAKALALDPSLSGAHAALGYIAHWFDWDTAAARGHFERAVQLSPSNTIALHDYGRFLLNFGDPEDALIRLETAWALDPGTAFMASSLGLALNTVERPREAAEVLQAGLRLQPNPYAQLQFAYSLYLMDRPAESIRQARLSLVDAGADSVWVMNRIAEIHALTGDAPSAHSLLDVVKRHPLVAIDPIGIAWVHVALSESDSAFVWLDRGLESHNRLTIDRKLRSFWADPIRSDPRYLRFLERLDREL